MLYEACMGVLPYAKQAKNVHQLRKNIATGDFIPIPEEVYGPELVRPRLSLPRPLSPRTQPLRRRLPEICATLVIQPKVDPMLLVLPVWHVSSHHIAQ